MENNLATIIDVWHKSSPQKEIEFPVQREIASIIRQLKQAVAGGQSQHQWAKAAGISSQARLSKVIGPKDASVQLKEVEGLCRALGFRSRLLLVKEERPRSSEALTTAGFWLPLFWAGMAFTNERLVPNAIVELIREASRADSAILYVERRERNALFCQYIDRDRLNHPEAMASISWSGEWPTQVIRSNEVRILKDLKDSPFVEREAISIAAAVPFGITSRSVLFLNFKIPAGPTAADLHKRSAEISNFVSSSEFANSLRDSVSVLSALSERAAPRSAPPHTPVTVEVKEEEAERFRRETEMPRWKTLSKGRVQDILSPLREIASTRRSLNSKIAALIGKALSVFLPVRTDFHVRIFDKNLTCVYHSAGALPVPDGVVRNVQENGVGFLSEDVNATNDLAYWERDLPIREGTRTKLTVPLRCDPLFSPQPWAKLPREYPYEIIYGPHVAPSRGQPRRQYAVVDVESRTQDALGPDAALDIGVLCNVLATTFELSTNDRLSINDRAVTDTLLEHLVSAMDRVLRGPKLSRKEHDAKRGPWLDFPLDELGIAAAGEKDPLFEMMDRCAIYGYDHIREGFAILAHFCQPDVQPQDKPVDPEYLVPRKGGNSERLLTWNDDRVLFIPHASQHELVSKVTWRFMEAKSLIGAPFRLGASFRTEGIIWLASHRRELNADYLDNVSRQHALQLYAAAVALLGVTYRIAGADPD